MVKRRNTMEDKKINKGTESVTGGALASANEAPYDRCPMCDNPTPVVNGRCHCTNCGHSWTAGSH